MPDVKTGLILGANMLLGFLTLVSVIGLRSKNFVKTLRIQNPHAYKCEMGVY